MKISELFNRSSVYNSDRSTEAQKVSHEDSSRAAKRTKEGEDRVSISPLARQFRQISEIVAEDQKNSESRVAALKERVANGEYSVESDDVAKSLVSFLKEQ